MESEEKQFHITVQRIVNHDNVPTDLELQCWIQHAVKTHSQQAEICIRIVDKEESAALNHRYRQKSGPTNVLSFPYELPPPIHQPGTIYGDLIVCAPLVTEEANAQNKPAQAHWAHLIIHGTLHLLGYDHVDDKEAMAMEQLETRLLNELGFPNPYEDTVTDE